MHILKLILVTLILPFVTAAILLVPMHIALLAANYVIYMQTKQEAAILKHKFDPFYQIETYQRLFGFWQAHAEQLPFFTHTLPLLAFPSVILLVSLLACYRFLREMKERFSG